MVPGVSIARRIDKYPIRASGSTTYYGLVASGRHLPNGKRSCFGFIGVTLRYLFAAVAIGSVSLDFVPRWSLPSLVEGGCYKTARTLAASGSERQLTCPVWRGSNHGTVKGERRERHSHQP